MSSVQEILVGKNSQVHTICESEKVIDAVMKMNRFRIGSLAVNQVDGSFGGIITERDILQWVGSSPDDLGRTGVQEIMTHKVIVCTPSTSLNEVRSIMKNHRIRHLPVVDDDGQLVGIISIGDINAYLIDEDEVTIQYLHDYIYGRV